MNIQELIKRIEKLPFTEGPIADTVTVNRKWILGSLKQIDEIKEVEIPQFVADWYEGHKDELEISVFRYVYNIDKEEESDFKRWFVSSTTKPFQVLFNMHQFGYKIKEEKKYTVRMIGLVESESYLKYNTESICWYLGNSETYTNNIVKHTMKDLEDSGFKDVFPSPLFEIVEVKE
mgnify:CR=1 FL=1